MMSSNGDVVRGITNEKTTEVTSMEDHHINNREQRFER